MQLFDWRLQEAEQLQKGKRSKRTAASTTAIAIDGAMLFAACSDNTLWKLDAVTELFEAAKPNYSTKYWQQIGAAQSVISTTVHRKILFALDIDGSVWKMAIYGEEPAWEPWWRPISSETGFRSKVQLDKNVGLSSYGGYLWGANQADKLVRLSATVSEKEWVAAREAEDVKSLAGPGPPGFGYAPLALTIVNRFCMALL